MSRRIGSKADRAIRAAYVIFDNQVATKRDMIQFYPALAREKVEVVWGSVMPMTRHRCRVIGQPAPSFATGLGGLGVTLSSVFGRVIAAGLVEDDQTWRLFEAFGLRNGGGQWGRVSAQFIYWSHRMCAGFAAAVP